MTGGWVRRLRGEGRVEDAATPAAPTRERSHEGSRAPSHEGSHAASHEGSRAPSHEASGDRDPDTPGGADLVEQQESGDTVAPVEEPGQSWRRLALVGRPRATKANALATLLAVALGFAIAAQVRQTQQQGLETLREDELVRILDTVNQDGSRLSEEIRTLETQRDRLRSGTGAEEARKAAEQRLENLGILSGTIPAEGPGIVLTLRDPRGAVTAPVLLDTLQELRDAGAEAIQINDVRVIASTYFTDSEGGIEISGRPVSPPYVFRAIGNATTLASAMDIPGGVSETVRSKGGSTQVQLKDVVEVRALQRVSTPQYARPVPAASASS